MIIAEDARGRGASRLLISAAIDWLESRGAPRIMLWTAARNRRARDQFTRLGFRATMVEMTRERVGAAPEE